MPRSRSLSEALSALPDLSDGIVKSDDRYYDTGAFGDVYRRQWNSGNGLVEVAVKSFRFAFSLDEVDDENERNTAIRRMIRREVGIWRKLEHANVVPFLGITHGFGRPGNASLVSLWMPNGSLQTFLSKYDDWLTVAHRLQLMLDVANGLCYLHSFPVIHGDLSCNNVLLDRNYNACLTDFGYASMVGNDVPVYLQVSTLKPGTLRWAAPELCSIGSDMARPTAKSDIYSFGNLALMVLSGKYPWSEISNDMAIMYQLAQGNKPKRPLSRPVEDQHWELIERCWLSICDRPSAVDVVSSVQDFLCKLPPPPPVDSLRALYRSNTFPIPSVPAEPAPNIPTPATLEGVDRPDDGDWRTVAASEGSSFFILFNQRGELNDLERAISRFNDAFELTPDGHSDKPNLLNSLGCTFLARFSRLGELSDLERAISRFRDAVELTAHDHQNKPERLNNLGSSLLTRFRLLGELSDLDMAIIRFRNAVDLTPDGHPDKPSRLTNIGRCRLARFERLGELNDLKLAICRFREAVESTPDGDPEKPDRLSSIGRCRLARFDRLGELDDLELAIWRLREAVELTPNAHPEKPDRLKNLGRCRLARFKRLGELSDLEAAITRFRQATELIPNGHPDKPDCLSGIGLCRLARFNRLGKLNDLDLAIWRFGQAVGLTPSAHPDRPGHLNNLGRCHLARFNHLGESNDLERAILLCSDAVELTSDNNQNKHDYLNNFGHSLLKRFHRLGELNDLERAISNFSLAVEFTPNGCPDKPERLNNLGCSHFARFNRLGELIDLEIAITKFRESADSMPDDHPDKPDRLSSIGRCRLTRFNRLGELRDLNLAIWRFGQAIELTPDHHSDRAERLNNHGRCHLARFNRLGEMSDLERAISMCSDAVELTSRNHPNRADHLSNLGCCRLARFHRLGEFIDLERAISRFIEAIELTPVCHSDKPIHLNNLGYSFLIRFNRLGELSDLERAISTCSNAVELTHDSHSDKAEHLKNLGRSFLTRFNRLGEPADLEEAISKFKNAVERMPDDHLDKSGLLDGLAHSFLLRFDHFGKLSDLERAISTYETAVDLTLPGHPDKPGRLNRLGNSLRTRFKHLSDLYDLEQAISMLTDAVDLTPDSYPEKPGRVNNLGNSLLTRYNYLGELGDVEQAISRFRNAVDLTPDDHPCKSAFLNNLAQATEARFQSLGDSSDLTQAISLYSHAASTSMGPFITRFRASLHWISCARTAEHHTLLKAYSAAVGLLPQIAWLSLSLTHYSHELVLGVSVVREAAAAALDAGLAETAVEWLEQGRSIICGDFFRLCSSYDELSAVYPDRASRLRQLSTSLEQDVTQRDFLTSFPHLNQGPESREIKTLKQEANRRRTLTMERDKLLREIRALPGFERFLLHKEFSQLRALAYSGPVVILSAAESRCDALVVLADQEHVIHVPLPDFTLEQAKSLQTSLKSLVRRDDNHSERGERSASKGKANQWKSMLSSLWECIAKPVLDSLPSVNLEEKSRIFWCPTGPLTFLPIHAAGLYDAQHSETGHKVSDFVVSSYIPTLGVLSPSSEHHVTSSDGLRILFVRQPSSDGLPPLPGVDVESKHIKTALENSSSQNILLESSLGTVEEVLGLMKEADSVHFACYGIQDAARPADSGFCLANQHRLTLTDMIALSRPYRGIAFLSACSAAVGREGLSDEAVHLTAGMLSAGYRGVVGSMWPTRDSMPSVVEEIYKQLIQRSAEPGSGCREAARVVQDAVGRLRDGGASFVEWVPFVYVGL